MLGIDGTSRNNKRLDGVASGFQFSTHVVESQSDEPRHVFTNNPSRPDCLDNCEHCRPEVAVIVRAHSLPGKGPRLAGESTREQSAASKPGKVGCDSHVADVGNIGPTLGEDAAGVWLDLGESDCAKSCPLCSEFESADAAEQIKVCELIHAAPFPNRSICAPAFFRLAQAWLK